MEDPKRVKLMSADQQLFEVEENAALQSQLIKNMIEDGCAEDIITLPNVNGETLARIIEWCKKHDEEINANDLKKWERDFVNVDQNILYNLIMAANYLDINVLLDHVCQKVADMIKGKQPEEIREIFNIENDFTPEEEDNIRKNNAWAFD